MTREELKLKAKNSLSGNWKESIKIVLMIFLISFLLNLILTIIKGALSVNDYISSVLDTLLELILTSLITLGFTSYFVKIAKGKKADYTELFSKTNMFKVMFITILLVFVYTFLWSLLFIIPGIIAAINYSQVYYILLDEPDIKASDAIKKSKKIMNGHKMDYFVLILSFLGWVILSILTFGIGFLWLTPYMQVTFYNFYESIKK